MSKPISKPMLFSGPMVRALLEGRKTQTRRIVSDGNTQGNWKWSEYHQEKAWVDPGPSPAGNPGPYLKAQVRAEALRAKKWTADDVIVDRIYPRVSPGDAMWVRETWAPTLRGRGLYGWQDLIEFPADGTKIEVPKEHTAWFDRVSEHGYHNRPSIHMPRWASRITLKVTDVRVQRLQDITREDALAEGIDQSFTGTQPGFGIASLEAFAVLAYSRLWESINGKGSWDANPCVWAYTFEVKR